MEEGDHSLPGSMAAVAEPEMHGLADHRLFVVESPGCRQDQALGLLVDEKDRRLPAEREFFEGDDVVEDVLQLVFELVGFEGNLQDIVDDFLMFRRPCQLRGWYLVLSAVHAPWPRGVSTSSFEQSLAPGSTFCFDSRFPFI